MMPLQQSMNTFNRCIAHLEALMQEVPEQEDALPLSRCIDGLKTIISKWESYSVNIIITKQFLDYLVDNVKLMLPCLEMYAKNGGDIYEWKLKDLVFNMTEEMAVLMRENYLRTGCTTASEDELSVMDFFERSKNWHLGDGTMVSEYYYVTVPTTVINELVKKMEAFHKC